MATIDYASHAMARELQKELELRLALLASPVTVSSGFDSNGAPLILLGPDVTVAGTQGGTIRVAPISWPNVQTSVGLSQPVYGPHVIEFVYENIAANTALFLFLVEVICAKRGTTMKLYRTAAATAPAYAQMTSGNLLGTYQPDPAFGFIGAM